MSQEDQKRLVATAALSYIKDGIALGVGTVAVVVIYLALNALFLFAMPVDDLAGVKQTFIDSIAAKLDGDELRAAQQAKDAVRAYELVYAALGA